MRKYFYYLIERENDSSNIDYCLIRTTENRDHEPGFFRISEDLAESLHIKCVRDEDRVEDIRFETQMFVHF